MDSDLAALRAAHLHELQHRYERILEEHHLDAVVLHSGTRRLRRDSDDNYWPLVTFPHFGHWLGLPHPDCLIVVRPDAPPLLVRYVDDSFWEAPAEDEVPLEGLELKEVRDPNAARELLPTGRVAFIGEPGAAVWGAFTDEQRNPPALVKALDRERTLKTPYEVECLFEANRRAVIGHKRLAEVFQGSDTLSELQLHLVYLATTEQDDYETPYKNIVAKGAHAATLHHIAYGKRASRSGSLLVDAGATFHGYASDVTRTYARGTGEAAGLFGALIASMDAMQQRLCSAVKPGLPYEDLHDHSHVELAGIMKTAGLIRGSVDEAVSTGITRAFLPHGLGHSLGVQTHDPGCATIKPKAENPWLRNTSKIEAGQVFTIEPGIYFIRSLLEPLAAGPHAPLVDWSLVEALTPFGGIRIEDDLHVREDGIRNLTREAFG